MAKAKIRFADANVTVTVPVGTRIIEISEKAGSYITYNCREGDCGNCIFIVVEGAENLSQPSEHEKKTLLRYFQNILADWSGSPDVETMQAKMARDNFLNKKCRLACQTQVFGDVTVAPV